MKLDIAQQITDRIISELEKGTAPWIKPWRYLKGQPGEGMPYNPASGTVYRGINHFWLAMQPYALPYYVTFKQAQNLGGTVKADQKARQLSTGMFTGKKPLAIRVNLLPVPMPSSSTIMFSTLNNAQVLNCLPCLRYRRLTGILASKPIQSSLD